MTRRGAALAALLAVAPAAAPSAAPPVAAPGSGELDARLVRVQVELDVFAPAGVNAQCNVKTLAPMALGSQVPLRVAVRCEPADQVTGWRIDDEGMVSVDLKDQTGEKHLTLTVQSDVLLMNSIGFDDTAKKSSLYKHAATGPLEEWLRPLAGAKLDDPDVKKAAAELADRAGDLLALVRGADELAGKRVKESATGSQEAGEALRKGAATKLGRARLVAALALAHGVPSRLLCAVPWRGRNDFSFLGDFHAGEAGWLRLDLVHRRAPVFPWPEIEDVVLAVIDADTPLAANSRLRPVFCRGGLTAGPKTNGAPPFDCRDLVATTCTRATAKEIVPALAAAFADERKLARKPGETLRVLGSAKAQKCAALVDWSAPLNKALAEAR